MNTIREFKKKLTDFYGLYSAYADILIKFMTALCAYLWVRSVTGYSAVFSNIFILLVLALVSSVLPAGSIALISGILIAGQSFALGLDIGGVVTAVLVVLFILFLRFIPEDSTAAILMAMGVWFGFGALVPLVCGLKKRLASVFAVASGAVICQLLRTMGAIQESLSLLEATAYPDRLKLFMGAMFTPDLIVGCIAAMAAAAVVYLLALAGFRYCLETASAVGAVLYVILTAVGNSVLGAGIDLTACIAGSAASLVVALILSFLWISLDYQKSEKFRIEDDEYYYYVKAIPKSKAEGPAYEAPDPGEIPEDEAPLVERPEVDDIDFESRLEDSLKNL